jgi:hypothetical protein
VTKYLRKNNLKGGGNVYFDSWFYEFPINALLFLQVRYNIMVRSVWWIRIAQFMVVRKKERGKEREKVSIQKWNLWV